MGTRRFRVVQRGQKDGYSTAAVEWVDDEDEGEIDEVDDSDVEGESVDELKSRPKGDGHAAGAERLPRLVQRARERRRKGVDVWLGERVVLVENDGRDARGAQGVEVERVYI